MEDNSSRWDETIMNGTLVWSVKNRSEEMVRSLKTADTTADPTTKFLVVDAASDQENLSKLRYAASKLEREVKFIESYQCMSLPQAWNLGIMLSNTEHIFFASSDVTFINKGWDTALNQLLIQLPYILIDNHSVFGINKKVMRTSVGWFDESFKSGPHFDPDYMIRTYEAGLQIGSIPNNYYIHGDDAITKEQRLTSEVKDRLPMNDFYNEDYFKTKWQTEWKGWKDAIKNKELNLPHPPTHISQVRRIKKEIDYHPSY